MSTEPKRPIQSTTSLLIPALLVMVGLSLSLIENFRNGSEERLDAAANRAIAAFAVARTINGVISVVQETQVGVSFGINTTLEPGQILDPLNDLIERFSTAALIAATLLWALKLLGGFAWLPWLPLMLALLLVLRLALERVPAAGEFRPMLMRGVRAGLVIWSFAAITPWLIDGVHHSTVIQDHYSEATQDLEQAGSQLADMASIDSLWDIDRSSLREDLQTLSTMADRLSRQAIIVLAVFVFEVLLLPLAIFWIGSRLLLSPRIA